MDRPADLRELDSAAGRLALELAGQVPCFDRAAGRVELRARAESGDADSAAGAVNIESRLRRHLHLEMNVGSPPLDRRKDVTAPAPGGHRNGSRVFPEREPQQVVELPPFRGDDEPGPGRVGAGHRHASHLGVQRKAPSRIELQALLDAGLGRERNRREREGREKRQGSTDSAVHETPPGAGRALSLSNAPERGRFRGRSRGLAPGRLLLRSRLGRRFDLLQPLRVRPGELGAQEHDQGREVDPDQ